MKSKIIKKILKILLYFIGALLLLFISLYFALKNPKFQTWATNRIAGYFAGKWGTTVHIKGVDAELWKKIVLEGVYVEDQHKDTLLYAENLKLDIGKFERDSQKAFFDDVILQDAKIYLEKYKGDSVFNFQFIIDEFASHDTSSKKTKLWNIKAKGLTLENVIFAYKIEKDTGKTKGINFSDLYVQQVNAKFRNIALDENKTHFTIEELSAREKSGFALKEFSTDANISPTLVQLDTLKLQTNSSSLLANLSFNYKNLDDFNDFENKVNMDANLRIGKIEMSDIAYFAHELSGIQKQIFIEGDVSGKINSLKGKNMVIQFGIETFYKGDFNLTGLPNIDETFMIFDIKEFSTSRRDLESIPIPPFNEKHFVSIPENISQFGTIKFRGNFTGFYSDFVAYGNFSTALGGISSDLSLKQDSASGKIAYHGKFKTDGFHLGKFLESSSFGNITMDVELDGAGMKKENVNTTINGKIKSLEFNGYNYQNFDVSGKFAKNIFDGVLAVKDENIDMKFIGNADFTKSPMELRCSADIAKANLSKLHFIKSDSAISISTKIDIGAVGNDIDDVTGKILLSDLIYQKNNRVYDFKNLQFTIDEQAGIKNVKLNSSFADIEIKGKFKPMEVSSSLENFAGDYLPSLVKEKKSATNPTNSHKSNSGKFVESVSKKNHNHKNEEFTYAVQFKNMDVVTKAFFPSLEVITPASFAGKFDAEQNNFSLNGNFPSIILNGKKFQNCSINASPQKNEFDFYFKAQRLQFSDSVWIDSVYFATEAQRDTADFHLLWKNSTKQQYKGSTLGYVAFSEIPKIKIKTLSSEITIADSIWKINPGNEIVIDTSLVSVRNFAFNCGKQQVKLEGNFSHIKEDQMYLILSSFNLADINTYFKGTDFSLSGTIDGNTSIGNIYDKPLFGSSLDIKNLKVNKEEIGNGNLSSIYDPQKDVISFNGGFKKEEGDNLKFYGKYFPSRDTNSIRADAEVKNFHLDFFEPFIKANCQNIKGFASAELHIGGTTKTPLLSGVMHTNVENIHINYLGTDYHFNGDVRVEPNSFDFSEVNIYDANHNLADIVDGKIFHTNFKKFQLDFDLELNKFLCLNTTEEDNQPYYGKVFATGIVNIFGYLDNINLTASVATDKTKNSRNKIEHSQLFIPLSNSSEVSENSFITFVKNDANAAKIKRKYKINTTGFTMDFKIEPTSDAQVQLIFDEKIGDVIKANGTGNMELVLNEFGELKMYGEYKLESGDYLFTLKKVIEKKFSVENGGTITWSGNPEDAIVNMNAIYQTRTNLVPLFPNEQSDAYTRRIPVNCILNLSGKLLSPDVQFDVALPTSDEFIRQQVSNKLKTNEYEMNKQVFSLLAMNSFIPSGEKTQQQESSGSGTRVGTVTTTEMLSSQLSNWLSQISKEFDVGVHYRPGDEINKDELELALSTQLLNDKLIIDGNVANNSKQTAQNTSNIVGDVNVEYKMTNKAKIKAFNKSNAGDIFNDVKGPFTQGVGVFYREEFDTLGELYKRFLGKTKKKS